MGSYYAQFVFIVPTIICGLISLISILKHHLILFLCSVHSIHNPRIIKVSSVNNYCSSSTFKHQLKKYMKIKPGTWSPLSTFLGLQMSCFLLAKFVIDLLKLSGLALQAIFALRTDIQSHNHTH